MITLQQLTRKPRTQKIRPSHVPRLDGAPQRKGTVIKVFDASPKKPNSAKRKVARVRLTNNKLISAHLPGIGHNLQAHSIVLVRGGRCQDLIGVRYKPIRGTHDFGPVYGRVTRRSKFGIKTKTE